MASVRSLDNALEVTSTVMAADGLNQAKVTGDEGRTHIPNNGRILRNLIHGADTVMSHITHFYALSALDFVDASSLGAPFGPSYNPSPAIPDYISKDTMMTNDTMVVTNYVESLAMRRKTHTLSAIFSGRHPIQNAIVPGGVTTLPTASDCAKFSNLLDQVRNFINTAYVPDVVTVATLTSPNYTIYWTLGTQPGNLLSYGEYPVQSGTSAEALLLDRGLATATGVLYNGTGIPTTFLGNVVEHVGYSYYSSPSQLKPSVGQTAPNVSLVSSTTTQQYSWLKAPRYRFSGDKVCEVGPLPRMYVSYLNGGTGAAKTVSGATGTGSGFSVTPFGPLTGSYTLKALVDYALTTVIATVPSATTSTLIGILGRHACRALEAKYVADAMADTGLTGATGNGIAWLSELKANGLTSPVYVYAKLPTKPKLGAGWAEAPRGALGHWITIEKKKIANYQCVVPSTWNHSPKDDNGLRGAAEQVLTGLPVGIFATATVDDITLTALRALHIWDFCIACAVHIVKADGSTIAKFKMGTDGSVTKLPHDAEI